MTYNEFRLVVGMNNWTLTDLRCEKCGPGDRLMNLINAVGLGRYERFVLRLEREATGSGTTFHTVYRKDGTPVRVCVPGREG